MTDIVTRLRRWAHAVDSVSASDLMDEAAAEIERLRNGALEARETVQCPRSGDCPKPDNGTNQDTVGRTLARRITRLQSTLEADRRVSLQSENPAIGEKPTLTDAEREAVERAADLIDDKTCGDSSTLRSLLERL